MENFRRAIGLRIKENKEVYEGEVAVFHWNFSSVYIYDDVLGKEWSGCRILRFDPNINFEGIVWLKITQNSNKELGIRFEDRIWKSGDIA